MKNTDQKEITQTKVGNILKLMFQEQKGDLIVSANQNLNQMYDKIDKENKEQPSFITILKQTFAIENSKGQIEILKFIVNKYEKLNNGILQKFLKDFSSELKYYKDTIILLIDKINKAKLNYAGQINKIKQGQRIGASAFDYKNYLQVEDQHLLFKYAIQLIKYSLSVDQPDKNNLDKLSKVKDEKNKIKPILNSSELSVSQYQKGILTNIFEKLIDQKLTISNIDDFFSDEKYFQKDNISSLLNQQEKKFLNNFRNQFDTKLCNSLCPGCHQICFRKKGHTDYHSAAYHQARGWAKTLIYGRIDNKKSDTVPYYSNLTCDQLGLFKNVSFQSNGLREITFEQYSSFIKKKFGWSFQTFSQLKKSQPDITWNQYGRKFTEQQKKKENPVLNLQFKDSKINILDTYHFFFMIEVSQLLLNKQEKDNTVSFISKFYKQIESGKKSFQGRNTLISRIIFQTLVDRDKILDSNSFESFNKDKKSTSEQDYKWDLIDILSLKSDIPPFYRNAIQEFVYGKYLFGAQKKTVFFLTDGIPFDGQYFLNSLKPKLKQKIKGDKINFVPILLNDGDFNKQNFQELFNDFKLRKRMSQVTSLSSLVEEMVEIIEGV